MSKAKWTLAVALAAALVLPVGEANAARRSHGMGAMASMQLAQSGEAAISPGEAASIAESANPGMRAINVKYLQSGQYVVTLKGNGNVVRVTVDAQSGAVY